MALNISSRRLEWATPKGEIYGKNRQKIQARVSKLDPEQTRKKGEIQAGQKVWVSLLGRGEDQGLQEDEIRSVFKEHAAIFIQMITMNLLPIELYFIVAGITLIIGLIVVYLIWEDIK